MFKLVFAAGLWILIFVHYVEAGFCVSYMQGFLILTRGLEHVPTGGRLVLAYGATFVIEFRVRVSVYAIP